MRREANIPLFLWVTTAVVVHLLWSGGADQGAKVLAQRLDIQNFARSVQNHVRGVGSPLEVTVVDENHPDEKDVEQPPPDAVKDEPEPEPKDAPQDDPEAKKKPPEKVAEAEKKPTPPPPEQKPEEKKPEAEKKAEALPAQPAPPQELTVQKRVAVKQVVEDDKQPDNPNAAHIADQANHVAEETQARITSADQNDAKPTPGGEHSNPDTNPGDSDESRVSQSEDRPGEKDHAPSETPASDPAKVAAINPPSAEAAHQRAEPAREESGAKAGADKAQAAAPAQQGQEARAASKESEASPEAMTARNGGFTVPGPRQALVDQAAAKARKARPLPKRQSNGESLLGFGSAGTTANGVNLNLAPRTAVAAIGVDQLKRERLVDGERRRSAHLGSWHPMDPSRWKSSIENYVPSVKPGNQTALNTAKSAFAGYLNGIHNRIHPIFADSFLGSLDGLPSSHPMNNEQLSTEVEIVLDQESGKLVRMGVTKFSGITAFDIASLDSVKRAAPFGTPPREIVSPDGRVYLHWEFHRNQEACSTFNARPFILKVQPNTAPPEITPPPTPSDPTESSPRQRHGQNAPRNVPRDAFAQK